MCGSGLIGVIRNTSLFAISGISGPPLPSPFSSSLSPCLLLSSLPFFWAPEFGGREEEDAAFVVLGTQPRAMTVELGHSNLCPQCSLTDFQMETVYRLEMIKKCTVARNEAKIISLSANVSVICRNRRVNASIPNLNFCCPHHTLEWLVGQDTGSPASLLEPVSPISSLLTFLFDLGPPSSCALALSWQCLGGLI